MSNRLLLFVFKFSVCKHYQQSVALIIVCPHRLLSRSGLLTNHCKLSLSWTCTRALLMTSESECEKAGFGVVGDDDDVFCGILFFNSCFFTGMMVNITEIQMKDVLNSTKKQVRFTVSNFKCSGFRKKRVLK